MRSEFENWFLSTPTGKALSTPNLGYYIFERHLDEYRDRDVEMAHRAYVYQQSKVDELQYKAKLRESDHQALLVKYQATKKCWEDMSKEKDELQKRVDAVKALIEEYRDPPTEDKTFQHALSIVAYELEQALKGGLNE